MRLKQSGSHFTKLAAGLGKVTASHEEQTPPRKSFLFVCFVFLPLSWAAPAAYGGSQARGPIGAVPAGLHQSHSNTGSKPHLRPTPQLTAMLDP